VKRTLHLGFAIIALGLGGCQTRYESVSTETARTAITSLSGRTTGAARIFSLNGLSTINVSLSGAFPGRHKAHLQQATSCDEIAREVSNADQVTATALPDIIVSPAGVGTMSANLPQSFGSSPIGSYSGTIAIVLQMEEPSAIITSTTDSRQIACGLFTRSR